MLAAHAWIEEEYFLMAVEAAADSNYSMVSGAHRLLAGVDQSSFWSPVMYSLIVDRVDGCGSKQSQLCWCDMIIIFIGNRVFMYVILV